MRFLLQDNEGLIRLQELLKSSTDSDLRTVVHQLSFEDKDDNKKILREVKRSGAVHIVLDCQLEKLRTVLKDAQVGIGHFYWKFSTNQCLSIVFCRQWA